MSGERNSQTFGHISPALSVPTAVPMDDAPDTERPALPQAVDGAWRAHRGRSAHSVNPSRNDAGPFVWVSKS